LLVGVWQGGDGYPNVWLGVTAGCRPSLPRLEILSQIPAAVRFVSAEPLLEAIDLRPYLDSLDWVITGYERAKKGERRLMDLDWVREIDAHCTAFGVPHFFKQYYENDQGLPREDGLLDGELRQNWPQPRVAVST
jgi:protein gp37